MKPIRILMVEDNEANYLLLKATIDNMKNVKVVGWVRNGLEALEKTEILKPDIITTDYMHAGLDGLELAGVITARFSNVKVILCTAYYLEYSEAFASGATGYIFLPTYNLKLLYEAIVCVARGKFYNNGEIYDSECSDKIFDKMRKIGLKHSINNRIAKKIDIVLIKASTETSFYLNTFLSFVKDFNIIGTFTNEEALMKIKELKPEIVLIDIQDKLGFEEELEKSFKLTGEIYEKFNESRVIIHSPLIEEEEGIIRSVECGAMGYVIKNNYLRQIIEAIYTVANGDYYFKDFDKDDFTHNITSVEQLR